MAALTEQAYENQHIDLLAVYVLLREISVIQTSLMCLCVIGRKYAYYLDNSTKTVLRQPKVRSLYIVHTCHVFPAADNLKACAQWNRQSENSRTLPSTTPQAYVNSCSLVDALRGIKRATTCLGRVKSVKRDKLISGVNVL
jgi:hypothetical protein